MEDKCVPTPPVSRIPPESAFSIANLLARPRHSDPTPISTSGADDPLTNLRKLTCLSGDLKSAPSSLIGGPDFGSGFCFGPPAPTSAHHGAPITDPSTFLAAAAAAAAAAVDVGVDMGADPCADSLDSAAVSTSSDVASDLANDSADSGQCSTPSSGKSGQMITSARNFKLKFCSRHPHTLTDFC